MVVLVINRMKDVGNINDHEIISRSSENLSSIANLIKFKKIHLANSKKSNLAKKKKSDFVKSNLSGADFRDSEVRKTFIQPWKIFIEVSIPRSFDPQHHIYIETNASKYAIGGIFSQMTLDQHFSEHNDP